MSRIAVTGAAGPVGRRVLTLLAAAPDVDDVVAVDRVPILDPPEGVTVHQIQLRDADLVALLRGVDTICHLAGSDPQGNDIEHDLTTVARVLRAAGRVGAARVVVRSSAVVYGAWSDNPIPLTEADPVHPNPGADWALARVRIEERVQAFAAEHPDVAVSVLRPCVTVSEEGPDSLGRVLASARLLAAGPDASPIQVVHADDVASAVEVVRRNGGTGAYNVAPDGWLDAERARALAGPAPRLRSRLPLGVLRLGWRHPFGATPEGLVPYAVDPWVVANDRLRSLGWVAQHANDEAFVAAHHVPGWTQLSPQRRQEISLGVAGTAVVGLAAAAGVALRRHLRR